MMNRIRSILIAVLIIACSFAITFAARESEVRIYNTRLVTNDLDATYIEGEVTNSAGQNLIITKGFETIASKSLPDTKEVSRFRIKIPAEIIEKDRVNVLHASVSEDRSPSPFGDVRVEITFKERNKQTIKSDSNEIEITMPGDDKKIKASATSGDKLSFSSSDKKVVKVKADGSLVPVAAGDADITIKQIGNSKYDSAEKTVKVSVKELDAYSITFHASNDSDKDDTIMQVIPTGTTEALNENTFSNGDHEFLGWATEDGGYVEYKDSDSVADLAEKGKNTDLYAVWTGDGAAAALAWAIDIANDDSFAYGTGGACHRKGCYFCGTNQRNKPSGYEKTYVCLTFVGAAYAHGAEDPEILYADQHNKMPMYENEDNFRKFSCWTKLGSCGSLSIDDLEPGDVIIKYAADNGSGHVCMYAGGDNVVEAAMEGWGADTISVSPGASSYLSSLSGNSKNYVMRYTGVNSNK